MINRITETEYKKLQKELLIDDKEVRITDLGNHRYYKLTKATKQEMSTFLAEWRDSKDGAELPSFPPKKG